MNTLADGQAAAAANAPMLDPVIAAFAATSNLVLGWSTDGVAGGAPGAFYNATPASFPSTDVCEVGSSASNLVTGLLNLKPSDPRPILANPTGFNCVWSTADVQGGSNGAIWLPTAPGGYAPLGCIFTGGDPPDPSTVWCVRSDLVYQAQSGEIATAWDTTGVSGGAYVALRVFTPSPFSPGVTTYSIFAATEGFTQPVVGLLRSVVRP